MDSCPKCFGSLENYRYACSSPQCGRAGIPVDEVAASGEDSKKQIKHECPQCGEPMSLRVCPDCGFELDAEEMRREFLPISLVGSQGSGKSNYLAVLIDQISGEMCKLYGCTLYPTGGDRTMDYYEREYRRPLYDQGVCVPTTRQEDLNPLTYTLLFPDNSETGKTVGLAFYDCCGKTLESQQHMALHNRSLYSSKGILFLLDPSQLPIIKEARKAKKTPVVEADPQALLLRSVNLIRAGLAMGESDAKIDIPLAVCLTKLDILYPHLDPASFIGDPSRNLRRPMLNSADISSCNLEAMALIESWGGREFVGHVKSQFSNYCFFGLSSLGAEPGKQNEVHRVSPHRALDPLLWTLWRNRILKAG